MAEKHQKRISPEEYVGLVVTLYQNRLSLFIGMVGQVMCLGVVYWDTRDTTYIFACLVLALNWLMRHAKMLMFDRTDPLQMSVEEARRWEAAYIVGSLITTLILGVSGGYSLYWSESVVAAAVATALIMTALVGIVGRNFGSSANIRIGCLAAVAPTAIGMFASGYPALMIIAIGLLPTYFSTVSMAKGIQRILRNALANGIKAKEVADQFEAALNNMPHGLIMLDVDKKIAVVNGKASALMGVSEESNLKGRSLEAMVRLGVVRNRISAEDGKRMVSQFDRLTSGISTQEIIDIGGDTYYEISANMQEKRGVVLNFENVTARFIGQRKIMQLARFDSLSTLPNRAYMAELLTESVAASANDSLIVFSVFDVDRFKQINDTMGHLAGDRVIQQVGQRMKAASDDRTVCARLGGDEFVIALTDIRPDEDINAILDRMYGSIAGTFLVNGKMMDINVSGGVIVYPKKEFSLDEALIKADLALYQSKKEEKTSWTLFENSLDEEFREQQTLKKELQKALSEGGLSAAYQPMLTTDGLTIACCEALARWDHPEMGFIPPDRFISVAEEMGLISEITRQMLNTACRDCMTWPEDMGVSVNLSAIDLANPGIIDVIRSALSSSGLPPERLQVEVTESVLVDDREKAKAILTEVKNLGVKLALDDFGTGYSSLSYLHSFPLDKIKIDRLFVEKIVDEEKARQVLRAMIRLSRDLGFEIVVEGIETEAQLDMLRKIGLVDLVQGYVFGRPMKPEDIPGYVLDVNVRQLRSATVHRIAPATSLKAAQAGA